MFLFKKNIPVNSSDEQLMKLMLKGSEHAFELLYERYFNRLCRYVAGFVNEFHIAQDLVQEVFMKLVESPGKFDHERNFSTWIYSVCANAAKNHLRDEKRFVQKQQEHYQLQAHPVVVQHHELDANRLRARMEDLLAGLSDKERTIYICRFQQNMSIRDIATELDIPEGSVKSGLYYLLKKFSNQLNYSHHES